MDILTSTTAVLSTIKNATEVANFLRKSADSLEKAEMNQRLVDVTKALGDAYQEIINNQQQLRDDAERICELEERLALKGELKWEKPFYRHEDGRAICPVCYEKDENLITLHEGIIDNKGSWDCYVCDKNFKDSSYNPRIGVIRNNSF